MLECRLGLVMVRHAKEERLKYILSTTVYTYYNMQNMMDYLA